MPIIDECPTDYDKAEALVQLLIDQATGSEPEESDFFALRSHFLSNAIWKDLLPVWFLNKRSLNHFWRFIQGKFPSYKERRNYLWKEFDPLLVRLETRSDLSSGANNGSTVQPGKILIGERLGKGGFGVVHEATQSPLKISLAIKRFSPSVFNDFDTALSRFYQEAEILMSLRHSQIIAVYGFGIFEDSPYILMEHFKGWNLEQTLEKHGNPPPMAVLQFLEKACDALHHAHVHPSQPVIHRDLKPSNLMTTKGDMRVLDFGIARKMLPDEIGITIDGQTIVGGAFSDPELEKNPKMIDPRSDIYGLGACWYYLLTGHSPSGSNISENLQQVDGVTKEYEAAILKSLDSLERRHQSMLELKFDIQALASGDSTPTSLDNKLSSNEQMLLGVIFSSYIPEKEPQSTWNIQNELSKKLSEFEFSAALARLRNKGFVSDIKDSDHNGNEFNCLKLSNIGSSWVSANENSIQVILDELYNPVASPEFDDDIPF